MPSLIKGNSFMDCECTCGLVVTDPDIIRRGLNHYGKDMVGILSEKQICFDGKKLKGVSPTSRGNHGLYIVNAWVAENRLYIGKKKVEDKSNEITAISGKCPTNCVS